MDNALTDFTGTSLAVNFDFTALPQIADAVERWSDHVVANRRDGISGNEQVNDYSSGAFLVSFDKRLRERLVRFVY